MSDFPFPPRANRRRFVATPVTNPVTTAPTNPLAPAPQAITSEQPELDQPAANDDDLPVLTDVVPAPALLAEAPARLPAENLADTAAAPLDAAADGASNDTAPAAATLHGADIDDIVANVEARLRAQLPALIAGAVATLEDDLKRGLTALVEDTLRDTLDTYLPESEIVYDEDLEAAESSETDELLDESAAAPEHPANPH